MSLLDLMREGDADGVVTWVADWLEAQDLRVQEETIAKLIAAARGTRH